MRAWKDCVVPRIAAKQLYELFLPKIHSTPLRILALVPRFNISGSLMRIWCISMVMIHRFASDPTDLGGALSMDVSFARSLDSFDSNKSKKEVPSGTLG